jgi:hypothetical protein
MNQAGNSDVAAKISYKPTCWIKSPSWRNNQLAHNEPDYLFFNCCNFCLMATLEFGYYLKYFINLKQSKFKNGTIVFMYMKGTLCCG